MTEKCGSSVKVFHYFTILSLKLVLENIRNLSPTLLQTCLQLSQFVSSD